jgi:diguanylate cyclase (GGDEF)-like protein
VLLFDLDNFKRINDRFGHQGGDAVLTVFARMARQFTPSGVFGRMGGEEFAAFASVADQTEAEALAETIRTEFCRVPVSTGDAIVPATVSVGVALASPLEANMDKLFRPPTARFTRPRAPAETARSSSEKRRQLPHRRSSRTIPPASWCRPSMTRSMHFAASDRLAEANNRLCSLFEAWQIR